MPRPIDLTGHRYGRLTVLREGAGRRQPSGRIRRTWVCRCDCGVEVDVNGNSLRSGDTRSCGCLVREIQAARCAQLTGENHPLWRGDEISYKSLHGRIRCMRGPASDLSCVDCGGPARDWSYRRGCPDERIERVRSRSMLPKDVSFCPHVEHYDPRCLPCHIKYDKREEAA